MAGEPAGKKRTVDRDGVVRVRRERRSWVPALTAGVLALVGGGVYLVLTSRAASAPEPESGPAAASRPVARRAPAPETFPEAPAPEPRRDPPRAEASPPAPPPAQEPVAMPSDAPDEHSGINLFHPGTKPIKVGIIVPEGFELPPGYVRHYQTTDDGKMLPPILMFHPDHPPLDAQGRPMAVPADRIVPPELAPKGMPIEMLQPPKPEDGASGP